MTNLEITEERLRNTRAWAAARVGSLSGADVIVAAIDELLRYREIVGYELAEPTVTPEPPAGTVAIGASVRLTAFYPPDIFGNIPADGWTINAIYSPKPNYEVVHPSGSRMVVSANDFAVNRPEGTK